MFSWIQSGYCYAVAKTFVVVVKLTTGDLQGSHCGEKIERVTTIVTLAKATFGHFNVYFALLTMVCVRCITP
jgi:hypothetical protein